MELIQHLQCKTPLGFFKTILIPNQFYGEVPPDFVQQHFNELHKSWHIWDKNGIHHKLTFGKYNIIPYLTDGWYALLNHLECKQATEITFTYYGGGNFLLSVGSITLCENFPSFHSHSTNPIDTQSFDVTLSRCDVHNTAMTLEGDFSDYVRSVGYKSLLLVNDHLDILQASIMSTYSPIVATIIGHGWKEFCRFQNYKEGDTIRFKFACKISRNLVHVRLITKD
ncbi:unnamed protein product [Trifolium pratense]|uniref:Uncharacterized protein n=1 Tax=Trifolium pratense TaxID=57577 RepID=A0ACB0M9N1_TRIPR|nr:unnamed protein product [Trifolium pratense]